MVRGERGHDRLPHARVGDAGVDEHERVAVGVRGPSLHHASRAFRICAKPLSLTRRDATGRPGVSPARAANVSVTRIDAVFGTGQPWWKRDTRFVVPSARRTTRRPA